MGLYVRCELGAVSQITVGEPRTVHLWGDLGSTPLEQVPRHEDGADGVEPLAVLIEAITFNAPLPAEERNIGLIAANDASQKGGVGRSPRLAEAREQVVQDLVVVGLAVSEKHALV